MIKAPPVAIEAESALASAEDLDEADRAKDELALRTLVANAQGRHFLKWLMDITDLEGPSGTAMREGERRVGMRFKVYCDSLGPEVYAGLVAEMTRDRATAEALRAKALA